MLVFEDLHWADESLLDFVDELVDWVTDVPLLVVGTARPELLERRPGWGGGKLNATTLALQPLSDEQTALLLAALLDRPVLAAESQQALLERAGGNPLYAEQFADLFLERGSADELPLPETLQGIIAARLDGLPEAEKELLRDAAVVGKVFWASALSRDRNDADRASCTRSSERLSCAGRNAPRSRARASSPSPTPSSETSPTARSRGRTERRSTGASRSGSSHSADRRTTPRCSRTTGARRSSSLAPRAVTQPTSASERGLPFATPATARLRSTAFAVAERYYSDALELWPDRGSRTGAAPLPPRPCVAHGRR